MSSDNSEFIISKINQILNDDKMKQNLFTNLKKRAINYKIIRINKQRFFCKYSFVDFSGEAKIGEYLNTLNPYERIYFSKLVCYTTIKINEKEIHCLVLEDLSKDYIDLFNFKTVFMDKDIDFSEDFISWVIKQICAGVSILHRNNISHNDLKLENIMINVSFSHRHNCNKKEIINFSKKLRTEQKLSEIKIIDFGLSHNIYSDKLNKLENNKLENNKLNNLNNLNNLPKIQNIQTNKTISRLNLNSLFCTRTETKQIHNTNAYLVIKKKLLGTPTYFAPEQYKFLDTDYNNIQNDLSYIGVHSDLWCIGIMAYVLHFGMMPFHLIDLDDGKKFKYSNELFKPKYFSSFKLSVDGIDFINNCLRIDGNSRAPIYELINHSWLN